jgi:S-formylglutathione hydrolase
MSFPYATRLATVALVLFLPRSAGAQPGIPAAAGTVVESQVAAASLKDNLLGDPGETRVEVYLPPSYASSPQRRYPVLYLLHGYLGDSSMFTSGRMGIDIAPTMDDQTRRGLAREMIIVMPTARNAYFGSF